MIGALPCGCPYSYYDLSDTKQTLFKGDDCSLTTTKSGLPWDIVRPPVQPSEPEESTTTDESEDTASVSTQAVSGTVTVAPSKPPSSQDQQQQSDTGLHPQTLVKASGEDQQGPVGAALAEPFAVVVRDQSGDLFEGTEVAFTIATGGGALSATTVATDVNGQATTTLTLGNELGPNTVTATIAGLEPVTFTANAVGYARPHSLAKVCGDSQEGPASTQLAESFVVSVLDEDGVAIAGVGVTFTVTAGEGTLSSAMTTTHADGHARSTLMLGSEPGPNTVVATVAGLEPVTFTAIGQESPLASFFDAFLGLGKQVALPDSPQLLQNAPNPFNNQTVLSYFLPKPGLVHLEVFALTGQRVAVLHQGPQQAGYHRLHWDGRDAIGHPLASGTYLYRLVTDETVLTRKLTLLR